MSGLSKETVGRNLAILRSDCFTSSACFPAFIAFGIVQQVINESKCADEYGVHIRERMFLWELEFGCLKERQ